MYGLLYTAAQIAREAPAWLALWPDLLVALGVAGILLYWTTRDTDAHWLSWPLVAAIAGIGNGGLGSIGAGLLYFHVRAGFEQAESPKSHG